MESVDTVVTHSQVTINSHSNTIWNEIGNSCEYMVTGLQHQHLLDQRKLQHLCCGTSETKVGEVYTIVDMKKVLVHSLWNQDSTS